MLDTEADGRAHLLRGRINRVPRQRQGRRRLRLERPAVPEVAEEKADRQSFTLT